ncbi:hypothetical protein [Paenibacillus brasilensis]|uniref:hypothetical protein n=1 Tax=Paenibacillus brasilensis TaxID=128574 RepID=UPI00126694D4|nr:hypothetical protein [Paenibacillus brasilensis]
MEYTKKTIEEKLNILLEESFRSDPEAKKLKVLKDITKVYKKLSRIKDDDQAKLYLLNLKIDEIRIKANSFISNKIHNLYMLFSILLIVYAIIFIMNSGNNFFEETRIYLKYVGISLYGALLFLVTTSLKEINEVGNKLLVAMIIPFIFISVLFIDKNEPFSLSNENVYVFLLGYSSDMLTHILNKMIEKVKAVFN